MSYILSGHENLPQGINSNSASQPSLNPIVIVDILNKWANDNNRETIPRKAFLEIAKQICEQPSGNNNERGYIIYQNDKVNSILIAALRELNEEQMICLRDCLIERTPPTAVNFDDAWPRIWDLCTSAGMKDHSGSGLEQVISFLNEQKQDNNAPQTPTAVKRDDKEKFNIDI